MGIDRAMKTIEESKPEFLEPHNPLSNFINGEFVAAEGVDLLDVTNPADASVIAKVPLCNFDHVDAAVHAAKKAFPAWSAKTTKTRSQILYKAKHIMEEHQEYLTDLIVQEHGKCRPEAKASLLKGIETMEYACGVPQVAAGRTLEVSGGIQCWERRDPIGVVGCIVPFNFPAMVPMWSIPMAIATGNTVVVKPSEKVPLTLCALVQCFKKAGLPDGVINVCHGAVDVVNGFCDHPDIKCVTFVGSTPVARLVSQRARGNDKRCLALGGAKNHLVLMPDADVEMCVRDICNSFAGSTGQRCMAASVLLSIGENPTHRARLLEVAGQLEAGQAAGQIGPLIDDIAVRRVKKYVDEAEASGAQILLDGRGWISKACGNPDSKHESGFWFGPTIILHTNAKDAAVREEIFGPVLSIYVCKGDSVQNAVEEAVVIENASPFGNAACIYTQSGQWAEYFTKRFSAAMLGVNIGVPVPREPFSFGGMNASKFGDCDITGDGGMELFTQRIKITQKWGAPKYDAADTVGNNFIR